MRYLTPINIYLHLHIFCTDCGTAYTIINGHVNFTGRETVYDQLIPVFCDVGYELQGESHVTCLSDGKWSNMSFCVIFGKFYFVNYRKGSVYFYFTSSFIYIITLITFLLISTFHISAHFFL